MFGVTILAMLILEAPGAYFLLEFFLYYADERGICNMYCRTSWNPSTRISTSSSVFSFVD